MKQISPAELTVRKTYPDAVEHWIAWDEDEPFCIAQIYPSRTSDDPQIGEGDTMEQAWEDAAKRLIGSDDAED